MGDSKRDFKRTGSRGVESEYLVGGQMGVRGRAVVKVHSRVKASSFG